MKAFEEVKPNLIITVPLVIEKIYKNVIQPLISKKGMKWALSIPLLDNQIYGQIRKKLIEALGGRFKEIIIGGAAMNPEVEEFFQKIKFPFTIGYGMTECGPLISYSFWKAFKERSCGKVVDRMEVRIDSEDPQQIVGEIQTRGMNVMLGYYKNEEATKATFTEDGWLKTGDLGILDKENVIYIRGRNKNMILGPSGQNIYPEEIEDKLNNSPYILESLATEENGKIVALIVPDTEVMNAEKITPEQYQALFEKEIKEINTKLPNYSKIASFRLRTEEFEKTPKRSIRRFKYQQ